MPSDKEMINNLIDTYSNLQRIKNADNAEKIRKPMYFQGFLTFHPNAGGGT